MLNALTIDVEDYFQVHAFSKIIRCEDWGSYECRVERNTYRLLEILRAPIRNPKSEIQDGISATFFVLGWIAERYSALIREIKRQGHEIASHGYNHRIISAMSPGQFREDVHRSKSILEDLTGEAVLGYRAPSFSIDHKRLWALEILAKEGYRYDSSIFPIRHDSYGFPAAPRFPFTILFDGSGKIEFSPLGAFRRTPSVSNPAPCPLGRTPSASGSSPCTLHPAPCTPVSDPSAPDSGAYTQRHRPCAPSLIEFPPSTIRFLRTNFPISGGGYFRLFPYSFIKKGLKRINIKEKQSFIFYLHPWEMDFEQPRIRGSGIKSRFRHYVNLDKTEKGFKKLLGDFQFSSIREIIGPSTYAAAKPIG